MVSRHQPRSLRANWFSLDQAQSRKLGLQVLTSFLTPESVATGLILTLADAWAIF